ncbi:MAG TPA: TIGR03617 family F420-dependent LLM class oxidoreductase [Ilumatobacteraceae bacterium]|nr:TIGR03617 family F420-dependent LLM class oxidoreductase [Ilumatobacteraceae bacterium]
MKIESLLPLGKLDPGLREPDAPLDPTEFASGAAQAEALGLDTVLVEETKWDPYQLLALGASSTTRIGLATSVAMAFPRSPTVTAMSAWTLQQLSAGRFTLGLGTQVRGHVRRRFGMEWHAPAPWMRDTVGAIRAVWRCWQNREPLRFESERYHLDLMVPLFDPGPIEHPDIPIHVAAIGPNMCAVAGEVADGVRLHPICTTRFIDERVKPAVERGAVAAGRTVADIEFCMKPLVATAPDETSLVRVSEVVRERVAFYLSTPAYRRVFDLHGWDEQAEHAAALSKAHRWDELSALVDDEMFHTVATVGTHATIAEQLRERYQARVDRIEFSIPVVATGDGDTLRHLLATIRSD